MLITNTSHCFRAGAKQQKKTVTKRDLGCGDNKRSARIPTTHYSQFTPPDRTQLDDGRACRAVRISYQPAAARRDYTYST